LKGLFASQVNDVGPRKKAKNISSWAFLRIGLFFIESKNGLVMFSCISKQQK